MCLSIFFKFKKFTLYEELIEKVAESDEKLLETFLQTQLLLLNHIIIPHLNHQKFLAIKLKKL